MSEPLLKSGLYPDASDALRKAGFTAGDLGQVIGNAAASAGTHAPDGVVDGHAYTVCTDFHIGGKDEAEVKEILVRLWNAGFAAWFRNPGSDHWPADDARHVHAVWSGAPMKPIVQHQVKDFLRQPMLNGLASHAQYEFFQNTHEQRLLVRTLFERNYHLDF